MSVVSNLSAQSTQNNSGSVSAQKGIYDPSGGTITLFTPHGEAAGDGPFTIAFEQGGLPTAMEEMDVDVAASNGSELCFVKKAYPFAPTFAPRALVVGEPVTDLTGIISPLPWADDFQLGIGINAVSGGKHASALKPFTPRPATTRRTSEHYRLVQNEHDMSQELELSASGKYNIEGVNLSASASYLSKITFSELYISLVAQYESVFDQYDEAERYELTDEARNLLMRDPKQFRLSFGDYFVSGVRRFSRFTAVYRCKSSSAESMQEFKARLGAEAPQVFSAEGSTRFMSLAKQHNIELEIQIDKYGFSGDSPYGPPWTVEKILQELDWCKRNQASSAFQAKLSHYSMIEPRYTQSIDIAPSIFVELRQLYLAVWDVRTRYESCPPAYKDALETEYTSLMEGVTANKTQLATNAERRQEYQRLAAALLTRLGEIFDRRDFYIKVLRSLGTEPALGQEIVEGTGVQTWLYGFKDYGKSAAVSIATSEMHYAESWHIGWREHTFEFGPSDKNLIVGWQVISNWNDGTNGSFWKDTSRIIGTGYGAVHVKSRYDRGCDWTVRIFYVPSKDYQFSALTEEIGYAHRLADSMTG